MGVSSDGPVVTVRLDQAIEVARLLESVVVSLGRLGSRMAGGEADAETLDRFLDDWLVGYRLSRARTVLWDAVGQVIGEEEVEEIAEAVPRFPDPIPEEVHQLRVELRAQERTWLNDAS
jgi:hypothetical protein